MCAYIFVDICERICIDVNTQCVHICGYTCVHICAHVGTNVCLFLYKQVRRHACRHMGVTILNCDLKCLFQLDGPGRDGAAIGSLVACDRYGCSHECVDMHVNHVSE